MFPEFEEHALVADEKNAQDWVWHCPKHYQNFAWLEHSIEMSPWNCIYSNSVKGLFFSPVMYRCLTLYDGDGSGGLLLLTEGMMTPLKWRCQGMETVLVLDRARSSLWLCVEIMCCFCSQCVNRNIGREWYCRLWLLLFPIPSFGFRSGHLTHACPLDYILLAEYGELDSSASVL